MGAKKMESLCREIEHSTDSARIEALMTALEKEFSVVKGILQNEFEKQLRKAA